MKIKKDRAEELLAEVERKLDDLRDELKECKTEIDILLSAKAYLEFIISGLERNPSVKRERNGRRT